MSGLQVKLKNPVKVKGKWYIKATPPHFEFDLGPYDEREEALEDIEGLEDTFNSPSWRLHMIECQEEEEAFEKEHQMQNMFETL